jgi:hypothetical protein
VLRGLCEVYQWSGDRRVLGWIEQMVTNLVIPTAGLHHRYPIDPAERTQTGSFMGTTSGALGSWLVSSDTGCDFIFMDGVIHAYQLLPLPALKALIEEMIARFLEMDLAGIKAQTHASLTAIRGLLRYAEMCPPEERRRLVEAAQVRFALYTGQAMSANFENFNWFGRPEWTEPCAVVDSFLAAVQLWRFTEETHYLATAQQIFYNGLGVEQRYNGGFGCNTCAGANDSPYLEVRTNEAHWCCTMRGAEGLARAAQFAAFTRGEQIFLPFYQDGDYDLPLPGGRLRLHETTRYPLEGQIRLEVVAGSGSAAICLFLPAWSAGHQLWLNGQRLNPHNQAATGWMMVERGWQVGDVLELSFDLLLTGTPSTNPHLQPNGMAWQHGPLLLGCTCKPGDPPQRIHDASQLAALGAGQYQTPNGVLLSPVMHLLDPGVWQENAYRRQVLF